MRGKHRVIVQNNRLHYEFEIKRNITVIRGDSYELSKERKNIKVYLPESFEWIILASGLIEDKQIRSILNEPEKYIDSAEYFSWERYYS